MVLACWTWGVGGGGGGGGEGCGVWEDGCQRASIWKGRFMCYLVNFTFFQKYIFKIDSFTAVLILQIVLLGFNYEPPSGGEGEMIHWGIALLLSDWRSVFEDKGEGVLINPPLKSSTNKLLLLAMPE